MADFGGWEMPIEYPASYGGGVINEHTAVRERVGAFDVSHLGKAIVRGAGAREYINSAVTNDLSKITPGQAQYTMLCDENSAGVIDDLIVYLRSDDDLLLIPNAANNAEVVDRLKKRAPSGVTITNAHTEFAVLAIQGPLAESVLQSLGLPTALEYMSFTEATLDGETIIICRTGYTGEKGFELLPSWSFAEKLWQLLVVEVESRGGLVAGLGARDTLRTEMCYPLHGHELSLSITPVQANASWAVGWNKSEFWGATKLREEKAAGPLRIMRPLLLQDRGVPRAEMKIVDASGRDIGVVTSGTFSPTLKQGIALALMDSTIKIGDLVEIDVRGRLIKASVAKAPLVPSHVR
jgi:aminomethyltransferase